jgi:hypothetical protein
MPIVTLTKEQKKELEGQLGFNLPSAELSIFASTMMVKKRDQGWNVGVTLPLVVICAVGKNDVQEILGERNALRLDNCCSPSSCSCNNGCKSA